MKDIIQSIYEEIREQVSLRLALFKKVWQEGTEEDVFKELVFCLMTPQTKARMAEKAIERLESKGLVFHGTPEALGAELNIVRFRYNKAKYIVEARSTCSKEGNFRLRALLSQMTTMTARREWLYKNVKGMGIKEASHFLRNIGFGEHFAILDRHVIRNLVLYSVIEEEPKTLSEKIYLEIEQSMKEWASKIRIPMEYLDFVLWYKEANDIFK